MAYYTLEPFGALVDDFRMAIICSLIANVMSSGKKRYKPQDFLPDWSKGLDDGDPGHRLLGVVEQLNQAFGGVDLRNNEGA